MSHFEKEIHDYQTSFDVEPRPLQALLLQRQTTPVKLIQSLVIQNDEVYGREKLWFNTISSESLVYW